ncbi:MAG: addiction module antitoxin RelB [Streptococcaceae bacterium]|nr:addiction module antitoxin RelB [Streptococcaceae bacterium]
MATTTVKKVQVNMRIDAKLLEHAKEIISAENMDMTSFFTAVLKDIERREEVPAELLPDKKTRRDRLIDELYTEIQKGIDDFESGKGRPMEEVFAKYEL